MFTQFNEHNFFLFGENCNPHPESIRVKNNLKASCAGPNFKGF